MSVCVCACARAYIVVTEQQNAEEMASMFAETELCCVVLCVAI